MLELFPALVLYAVAVPLGTPGAVCDRFDPDCQFAPAEQGEAEPTDQGKNAPSEPQDWRPSKVQPMDRQEPPEDPPQRS